MQAGGGADGGKENLNIIFSECEWLMLYDNEWWKTREMKSISNALKFNMSFCILSNTFLIMKIKFINRILVYLKLS